jgi:hypothetical protein
LFERLDVNEKFSEDEARYWMHQVLNVSYMVVVEREKETNLIVGIITMTFVFVAHSHPLCPYHFLGT